MAEGTSLLRMHTAYTCIVSSNLTVSAKTLSKFILDCQKTRSLYFEASGFLFFIVQLYPCLLGAFFGAVPVPPKRHAPKTSYLHDHG